MAFAECVEFVAFILVLAALTLLLGRYIAAIFDENKPLEVALLSDLEKLCYRAGGVDQKAEMSWGDYARTLVVFNVIGFCFVVFLQLLQGYLPLNPQGFGAPAWHSAFNTAASFTTNTNWQSYAGETTLSYLTQMFGLGVQNFLSAATGMCVLLALTRGFIRHSYQTIGNFWSDLVKTLVYLLLPLSLLFACFLVSQGTVQSFGSYIDINTMEGAAQTIPLGPVASQVAIKQLGTNGGGFFNANSAHPFENPNEWSNFFECLAILLIPAALIYAYGILVGSKKHALVLLGVVSFLWIGGLGISLWSESIPNPVLGGIHSFEGKEVRFGNMNSLLWAVSTSGTSNGSVNAMLSSLSPLAGGVALFNIMLGELIFGGIGVGLCSLLFFTMLTIFLSGLMVGRTPEYLGKKIEKSEMQWILVGVLVPGLLILIGTAVSAVVPNAVASIANKGPHGFTEILYAFSSAAGNNGSAFGGLNANTVYYNVFLGVVMLAGRAAVVVPSLALAGLMARKKSVPYTIGTFSTDGLQFFILLTVVIIIIGALTFFPALSLGPIVEQLLMLDGRAF